jgi:KUP system potassium uptake protein
MTKQAVQLGFLPRLNVRHTDWEAEHQVYLPAVNWCLAVACIALVLVFRASGRLAAAYGIAVSGTMVLTSLVFFEVVRRCWRWHWLAASGLLLGFLCLDLPFLCANAIKIPEGGYVPLVVAACLIAVMRVWKLGQDLLNEKLSLNYEPLDSFVAREVPRLALRAKGTAVFLVRDAQVVPAALQRMLTVLPALQERVLVMSIRIAHVPQVSSRDEGGLEIEELGHGFVRVRAVFGFQQRVDVPARVQEVNERLGLGIDPETTTYYLRRETFVVSRRGKMGRLSEGLFSLLSRNTHPMDAYFRIPPKNVFEIGAQFDL